MAARDTLVSLGSLRRRLSYAPAKPWIKLWLFECEKLCDPRRPARMKLCSRSPASTASAPTQPAYLCTLPPTRQAALAVDLSCRPGVISSKWNAPRSRKTGDGSLSCSEGIAKRGICRTRGRFFVPPVPLFPPVSPYLITGRCPNPPLVGEAGKQLLAAFYLQGDPCHSVKGCPDADASSVLSLDSIPAPRITVGLPERRSVPSFHRNRVNNDGMYVAFSTNKSDSHWSRAATPLERTV